MSEPMREAIGAWSGPACPPSSSTTSMTLGGAARARTTCEGCANARRRVTLVLRVAARAAVLDPLAIAHRPTATHRLLLVAFMPTSYLSPARLFRATAGPAQSPAAR